MDLKEIGEWIAQESNVRSETFVEELRRACESLGHMPRAFPRMDRPADLRRKPYKSYLIFYAILDDAVQIARVIHAARDYMRLLFPTPPPP
jgi:plasmid stabilization system protein ParE